MKKETLQFEMNALADALAKISNDIDAIDNSGEVKDLTHALTKEIEEHLRTQADLRAANATIGAYCKEISALKARFSGLEADMSGTMRTLDAVREKNTALQESLGLYKQRLYTTENGANVNAEALQKERESNVLLRANITTLESQVTDDARVAAALRTRINRLEYDLDDEKRKYTNVIKDLEATIDRKQAEIGELRELRDRQDAALIDMDEKLRAFERVILHMGDA